MATPSQFFLANNEMDVLTTRLGDREYNMTRFKRWGIVIDSYQEDTAIPSNRGGATWISNTYSR